MNPDETRIIMRQLSRYGWQLVSPKGYVLQTDLYFNTLDKAEEYVKNYISSFLNWSYEIEQLEE